VDWASGFGSAGDFLRYARLNGDAAAMQQRLRSGTPAGLLFWYRSSPRQMVPTGNSERVTESDPPATITNMRTVILDSSGRLVEFSAVPPQLEDPPPPSRTATNWPAVVQFTGLDFAQFKPVTPQWTPRGYSDERVAWEGPLAGWPEQHVRIEAAAYRGRPTFLQLVYPWTQPALMREEPRTRSERIIQGFVAIVVLIVLGVAALVARHNLRKGRGDRRGALRVWSVIFAAMSIALVVRAKHVTNVNIELDRLFTALGWSLFCAGAVWLLYLALEPYVRKFWPTTLISWSRFVAGNVLDAQVGRDVLIGVGAAAFVLLLTRLDTLVRPMLGYPTVQASVPYLDMLMGPREVLWLIGQMIFSASFNAVWIVFGLVAVNLVARRAWITAIVMMLFLMLTGLGNIGEEKPVWLGLVLGLSTVSVIVFVMLRFGLLATLTFFFANFVLSASTITLDLSKWFFPRSMAMLLLVAALAFYGFYASRGGEPLLGRRILD
jgi:hypothetical protein